MQPNELELYSTKELINELLRRTTFQGVIIHSRDEARNADWENERVFNVCLNANLDIEKAGRLLGVVSNHLVNCDS